MCGKNKVLYKHKDLSSNPQTPHKKPDMVIPTCHPRDVADSLASGSVRDLSCLRGVRCGEIEHQHCLLHGGCVDVYPGTYVQTAYIHRRREREREGGGQAL